MKIGIACYPTYGGSGVLATELGLALAEEGHEIHFLAYEAPIRLTSFSRQVFYHQVSVQEYPLFKYPPYALALATKLAEVCELHDLDLIHVHYAVPHLVSALLARDMLRGICDVKVIGTLHGTDITIVGNDPAYRRVTRHAIEEADGITAVSEYLRRETRTIIGTSAAIEVISNFVDLQRFAVTPCPQAMGMRHDGESMLVHISNFRPVKRVLDLIEAMAILGAQRKVRLLMVGDGPDRPAAEARARQLGIADRVDFLGSQDAIEKILTCADLFVLPSLYESFGLAALEAMACGVPVLASDAGGLPEVITDGVDGILEPPGSVEAMARRALNLLRDAPAHAAMRSAALQRAATFSAAAVVPQYEAFYEEILAR